MHGGVRWRVAFGLFSRIYCNYLGYGISIIYIPHFPPTSRLVLVLPIPHYLPYRQAVSIICSGRLFSTKNYIIYIIRVFLWQNSNSFGVKWQNDLKQIYSPIYNYSFSFDFCIIVIFNHITQHVLYGLKKIILGKKIRIGKITDSSHIKHADKNKLFKNIFCVKKLEL